MKKAGIITAIAIGIAAAIFVGNREPNDERPLTGETKTYTDPEGVFSFEYPEAFSVSGRDGAELARIEAPNSDALLTINWSSGATDESCARPYKKIYDGDCYAFVIVNLSNDSKTKEAFDDIIESFQYLVNSD